MSTTIYQRRICRRLNALMDKHHLSQVGVADSIGVSQPKLSRFLAGNGSVGIDTLGAICRTFGGSISDWLNSDEKKWLSSVDNYSNANNISLVDRRRSRSAPATGTH